MLLGVRYEGRKSTFCGEYICLFSCPSVTRTFVIPFVGFCSFRKFFLPRKSMLSLYNLWAVEIAGN